MANVEATAATKGSSPPGPLDSEVTLRRLVQLLLEGNHTEAEGVAATVAPLLSADVKVTANPMTREKVWMELAKEMLELLYSSSDIRSGNPSHLITCDGCSMRRHYVARSSLN